MVVGSDGSPERPESAMQSGLEASDTEMGGLAQTVVELSGLPIDAAQDELEAILHQSGISPVDLTLDDLRTAMLAYLEQLHLEFEAAALLQSNDVAGSATLRDWH